MVAQSWRWSVVVVLIVTLTGCPRRRHHDEDASAGGEADAEAPLASNVDDVKRFNDETAIDNASATLAKDGVNIRKEPPTGEIVSVLAKGTDVTQIAKHDKFILVTFDNPKDSSQRLMGWVTKNAFDGAAPVATASVHVVTKKCPPGLDSFVGFGCKKFCPDDDHCADSESCSGKGTIEGTSANVSFCVPDNQPPQPPPPPPPPPPPAVVDAGGGRAVVVDAGGGGGGGPSFVVSPNGGACPGGFALVGADGKCHKSCTARTALADCSDARAFCVRNPNGGGTVCSASRHF